jgi:hypothetical protein
MASLITSSASVSSCSAALRSFCRKVRTFGRSSLGIARMRVRARAFSSATTAATSSIGTRRPASLATMISARSAWAISLRRDASSTVSGRSAGVGEGILAVGRAAVLLLVPGIPLDAILGLEYPFHALRALHDRGHALIAPGRDGRLRDSKDVGELAPVYAHRATSPSARRARRGLQPFKGAVVDERDVGRGLQLLADMGARAPGRAGQCAR